MVKRSGCRGPQLSLCQSLDSRRYRIEQQYLPAKVHDVFMGVDEAQDPRQYESLRVRTNKRWSHICSTRGETNMTALASSGPVLPEHDRTQAAAFVVSAKMIKVGI